MDEAPSANAKGVTASERHLTSLAHNSFLDLWSYPNVHRDAHVVGGRVMGKEICDLLVVCGDHVLIFSDKTVAWPDVPDINVAWCRWYKHAIQKSAKQVRGAQRWIELNPERVFVDAACNMRLPLEFPPVERRKVHGIVVASGAKLACQKFFGEGSGSLVIKPDIKGDAHASPSSKLFSPFAIGDIAPDGPFIHVFDEVALNIVMRELDTISDFTNYLEQKAILARSQRLEYAAGEEDLLAWYLTHLDGEGRKNFPKPDGSEWGDGDRVAIASGRYARLQEHPQYIAKKAADKISYVWDSLITAFTKHIVGGTIERVGDFGGRTTSRLKTEIGVRYMAYESRFQRRMHGQAVIGALKRPTHENPRFFRAMLPSKGEGETAFGILVFGYPKEIRQKYDYNHYREVRSSMLMAYAMNIIRKHQHLKRFVGIAMEPPADAREGCSEDMVFFEPREWTAELVAEAERLRNHYDVVREGRATESPMRDQEYPETLPDAVYFLDNSIPYHYQQPAARPNRQERRAQRARGRRKKS